MPVTARLDAATIARTAPPVLLLLAALALPALSAVGAAVLAGGAAVAIGRRAPVAWAWAAAVPAASLATARWLAGLSLSGGGQSACAAFGLDVAWWLLDAVVVLGTFAVLAVGLGTRRRSVGLRLPARRAIRDGLAGTVALAVGGLVVISVLQRAVPGPSGAGAPSLPAFLAAVLLGGVAVATAEEVAFRGVLQHWLARATGAWPAVVVQGVAYGVWTTAVGWGPILGVMAAGAGIVAGVVTARTSSVFTAWAWHLGVAIALVAWILCA